MKDWFVGHNRPIDHTIFGTTSKIYYIPYPEEWKDVIFMAAFPKKDTKCPKCGASHAATAGCGGKKKK